MHVTIISNPTVWLTLEELGRGCESKPSSVVAFGREGGEIQLSSPIDLGGERWVRVTSNSTVPLTLGERRCALESDIQPNSAFDFGREKRGCT